MAYRVRGTVDATSRVLLFNESDMSLERSSIFETGEWELIANDVNLKTIIARAEVTGESYGFGGVTPETYEDPDVLLAINSMGDFLAIDGSGNGLIVEPI